MMVKKTITYTDFNNVERTEAFYFYLSEAEAVEMEMGVDGGLSGMLQLIVEKKDIPKIITAFKSFILSAYGEKSPDGKRFIKSKEISEAFSQTEAFSKLFMEFATDANAAADFINALVPDFKALIAKVEAQKNSTVTATATE